MDNETAAAIFGYISIGCWIVVFTPQFYENYKRKNTDGVSITFLTFWIVGDIFNLIGIILDHLLFTMLLLAIYYLFADIVLLSQIYYYRQEKDPEEEQVFISSETRPNSTFLSSYSSLSTESVRIQPSIKSWNDENLVQLFLISSVLIWLGLLLGSVYYFFGSDKDIDYSQLHWIPQLLGWASAILYCTSRIPQINQNFKNKSVEGLSLIMFIFSVVGNLTFCISILLKSMDPTYLLINYPWLLGSGGTLFFDFTIFFQFYIYHQRTDLFI